MAGETPANLPRWIQMTAMVAQRRLES
jgi:hypothetical protein